MRSANLQNCAAAVVACVALAACATPVSTMPRPDAYYASVADTPAGDSLFAGDADVLGDEAIQRILDYRYAPPKLSRVALMSFGSDAWSRWSEELSIASETEKREVIDILAASPRIYDASYLPSILVPEHRTVPKLREAAARYQADLLLVYRSDCRSFDKYRLLGPEKSRSFCSVEAVLLDTRTGLVPFTSIASRTLDVVESDTDTNFQETRLKAQLAAVSGALSDVSREVVAFLDRHAE